MRGGAGAEDKGRWWVGGCGEESCREGGGVVDNVAVMLGGGGWRRLV